MWTKIFGKLKSRFLGPQIGVTSATIIQMSSTSTQIYLECIFEIHSCAVSDLVLFYSKWSSWSCKITISVQRTTSSSWLLNELLLWLKIERSPFYCAVPTIKAQLQSRLDNHFSFLLIIVIISDFCSSVAK